MIGTCYVGDVRDGLRAFIAAGHRAQTCVTSPPYWGLRDYGTAEWDGGDTACPHRVQATGSTQNKGNNNREGPPYVGDCGLCGAARVDRQIGLEPTPAEYVATMVDVFRHVRDALADDGTLWLNLGDTYAAQRSGTIMPAETLAGGVNGHGDGDALRGRAQERQAHRDARGIGLKHKDLVGIPWRVAFALQADGWYLRSDVIWHKPNPMPESVTDRPTKAHEYLFLLAKSERYFYDADAIAEPTAYGARNFNGAHTANVDRRDNGRQDRVEISERNRRTVWTIATEPYSEAHFATFPTALIEPCILAGTSAHGHCPTCGKGWERVTERERTFESGSGRSGNPIAGKHADGIQGAGYGDVRMGPTISTRTTGWQPTCTCGGVPVPGVVLDPFLGSGTTAKVAQSLGRAWFGCELNPQYAAMQSHRAAQLGMAFI